MRRVYPVSLCFFPARVHFFTKDLVVPSASNRRGSESSTHAYLKKGCLAAAHIFCGNKAPEVWIPGCGAFWVPGCAAFWVPDQNAPARGFLAQARSAANAATAARRTPQEGRQCPPLVRTPPASLVHRSVRAQCRGVLRCGPGRVGGACLGKKQVGAGCDMRVPSTQPKAGTLPGDT